jgi:hypothetical protein
MQQSSAENDTIVKFFVNQRSFNPWGFIQARWEADIEK